MTSKITIVNDPILSPSILSLYLNEIRDQKIQKDPLRFRTNISRITHVLAYELSKKLEYSPSKVQTPLGIYESQALNSPLVLASILRAGIPMHQAMLELYDNAQNAFISAYRQYHKNGTFEIILEYISSPSLEGQTLVLCDPMIATGASILATLEQIKAYGIPSKVFVVGIIGSQLGLDTLAAHSMINHIIVADCDSELTAKGYIVPGLGDAGDLIYGTKL